MDELTEVSVFFFVVIDRLMDILWPMKWQGCCVFEILNFWYFHLAALCYVLDCTPIQKHRSGILDNVSDAAQGGIIENSTLTIRWSEAIKNNSLCAKLLFFLCVGVFDRDKMRRTVGKMGKWGGFNPILRGSFTFPSLSDQLKGNTEDMPDTSMAWLCHIAIRKSMDEGLEENRTSSRIDSKQHGRFLFRSRRGSGMFSKTLKHGASYLSVTKGLKVFFLYPSNILLRDHMVLILLLLHFISGKSAR